MENIWSHRLEISSPGNFFSVILGITCSSWACLSCIPLPPSLVGFCLYCTVVLPSLTKEWFASPVTLILQWRNSKFTISAGAFVLLCHWWLWFVDLHCPEGAVQLRSLLCSFLLPSHEPASGSFADNWFLNATKGWQFPVLKNPMYSTMYENKD